MIWLIILGEILAFIIGSYHISKYDKEVGLKISIKEYVIMGLIFAAMEMVLFSFYGYGREFIYHSLSLYYLIFAAFIDYKTQKVYRIGSIGFIFISLLLFFVVKDMSLYEKTERILWIMVFSIISIMQGTLGWTGWGDVFTYIGVFLSLGTWQYSCMTIEALAVYMLFANLIFLISNIRKFNWKRLRMKTDSAFLPAMAGAMLVMEVLLQYLQKI